MHILSIGHTSSDLSTCFANLTASLAPLDKILGLLIHSHMRNRVGIVMGICVYNVRSDSFAIILLKLFILNLTWMCNHRQIRIV